MPHNEHTSEQATLFAKWLDGETLTDHDMATLKASPLWDQRISTVETMTLLNEQLESTVDVPEWDRSATFVSPHQLSAEHAGGWLTNHGMSLIAMSFSIVACLFIAFDLKINLSDQGPLLLTRADYEASWNKAQQQQELEQRVYKRLDTWLVKSAEHLNQSFSEYEQRQNKNTSQLITYLVESSRIERQQDINQMVKVLQAQQVSDLQYLEAEISHLQHQFRLASFANEQDSKEPVSLLTEE